MEPRWPKGSEQPLKVLRSYSAGPKGELMEHWMVSGLWEPPKARRLPMAHRLSRWARAKRWLLEPTGSRSARTTHR